MLGAIYTGLSGLNAYSQGLETVSDNVANLNTAGFKGTTLTFQDLFGAGDSRSYSANSKGQQTGQGVHAGTPLIDFTQGDLRPSSNDLDLAIKGGGFLVLLGEDTTYYARTGQFLVDDEGFIAQAQTGHHLAILDDSGRPGSVNIDSRRTSPPSATTKVVFADNLSSSGTTATVSDLAIYDSGGGKQVWTATFAKSTATGATNEWTVTVTDSNARTIGTQTLKFIGSVVDPATSTLTFTDGPSGAAPLSVVFDFSSGVSSFSGGTSSTLRAASVDGEGTGTLTSVTVDDKGQLKLGYSNENDEVLGKVALADFRDPQQLERIGDGLYRNDGGAGRARLLASGSDGIGTLVSRQIEASNVNLSDEFGELILIQRGFQASSQVVSIANDMIQQLFGITGRG